MGEEGEVVETMSSTALERMQITRPGVAGDRRSILRFHFEGEGEEGLLLAELNRSIVQMTCSMAQEEEERTVLLLEAGDFQIFLFSHNL